MWSGGRKCVLIRRNVACFQVCLPVEIRPFVAPLHDRLAMIIHPDQCLQEKRRWVTYSHLLGSPNIQVNGFDLADMRPHPSMDT